MNNFAEHEQFNISTQHNTYPVTFLSTHEPHLPESFLVNKTHCVMDSNVARLHGELLNELKIRMPVLRFDATEHNKSWDGTEKILKFFTDENVHRKSHVLVVGGGITQDTSAFACHIFHRGIKWSLAPTTLLAMADSCVGGKAAINREGIKNQIGVFDTPQAVLIQKRFLSTLPASDRLSGFGEILKSHLLAGEKQLTQFEVAVSQHGSNVSAEIMPLIASSLALKKRIVEADEFENNERKLLNYGHTFGHALETLTNHSVPHGLAVAWGMACVNHIAMRRGWMTVDWKNRVNTLIKTVFPIGPHMALPNAKELLKIAAHDKKRTEIGIELVVMHRPGDFSFMPFLADEQAITDIENFLEDM